MVSDSERKSVQYLRPTSFEDQQREKQELNRTRMNIIPYATFHEKYFLVPFRCVFTVVIVDFSSLGNNCCLSISKGILVIISNDSIMNFSR